MIDVHRQEWRDLVREDALEASLPLVDAHHHFFPVAHRAQLEPCEPEEFFAEMRASAHNVEATVHVEAFANYRTHGPEHLRVVGETENIEKVVRKAADEFGYPGACAAIVGNADLTMGQAVAEVLDAHMAASQHLVGVRRMTVYDPDLPIGLPGHLAPGLLGRAEFHAGMKEVVARGLTFDAGVVQSQLFELADFANAFSTGIIVLGHIGGPLGIGRYEDRPEEAFSEWYAGIKAVSRCPNVVVKIGGLNMPFTGLGVKSTEANPLSSEQMAHRQRRHVLATIELFGPERCMFESNFPVDRWHTSYRVLWNSFKLMTRGFSLTERDMMFGGTARRVYRISDSANK
jgi:predicted TIM-barrel fold metal-dependent hydrolase